jgi:hypothetical protein
MSPYHYNFFVLEEELNLRTNRRNLAALYKYKHRVPLDGTAYFYNDTDYHKDHPIRSLKGIPSELEPHHQFIWWLLKTYEK